MAASEPPASTSLSPPRFRAVAAEAYEAAIGALEAEGIGFLVGGALALNAHTGVWRDTKDLDLFVRPSDAWLALETLDAAGFRTETVYESWLGKAWRGDVFVDLIWRGANALFPVQDAWFERPATLRVFGRSVPVLAPEELIVSKMMVMGRYRYDGADIAHVLFGAGERIDWTRLADLCGEHVGLMLAHLHAFRWAYPGFRDRVPDEVLDDFSRRARAAGSSFGPFRGRLLDLQSFEVDVRGWGMPDPHRRALERIFGDAEGRA